MNSQGKKSFLKVYSFYIAALISVLISILIILLIFRSNFNKKFTENNLKKTSSSSNTNRENEKKELKNYQNLIKDLQNSQETSELHFDTSFFDIIRQSYSKFDQSYFLCPLEVYFDFEVPEANKEGALLDYKNLLNKYQGKFPDAQTLCDYHVFALTKNLKWEKKKMFQHLVETFIKLIPSEDLNWDKIKPLFLIFFKK